MGQQRDPNSPDVVIGEDWEKDVELSNELKDSRLRRGLWAFRKSPLTRKIVTFNLIALNILIIGVLFLNSSRDNLVQQRARAMLNEAELVGNVVSVLHAGGQDLIQSPMLSAAMTDLPLRKGEQVYIFDANRSVVTTMVGRADITADGLSDQSQPFTPITNTLEMIWSFVIDLSGVTTGAGDKADPIDVIVMSIDPVLSGKSRIEEFSPAIGQSEFLAMAPIQRDGNVIGIVALRSATGEMNALVKVERERVLQLLLIGTIVSIALSLVLASTISNPLSDLATAAELGRDKNSNRVCPVVFVFLIYPRALTKLGDCPLRFGGWLRRCMNGSKPTNSLQQMWRMKSKIRSLLFGRLLEPCGLQSVMINVKNCWM